MVKKKNSIVHFRMDNEITIYNVAELKSSLYDKWEKARELELNLCQVEELDSAGVQLLLQLKQDSESANKPLRLVGHSAVVVEVFEMFNLIGRFGDPVVMSAVTPGGAYE